jgi:hypothetical protein
VPAGLIGLVLSGPAMAQPATTRASEGGWEIQANRGSSGRPAISADGRWVAFESCSVSTMGSG